MASTTASKTMSTNSCRRATVAKKRSVLLRMVRLKVAPLSVLKFAGSSANTTGTVLFARWVVNDYVVQTNRLSSDTDHQTCAKLLPNMKAYPFENDIYCKEHWHEVVESTSANLVKAALAPQQTFAAKPTSFPMPQDHTIQSAPPKADSNPALQEKKTSSSKHELAGEGSHHTQGRVSEDHHHSEPPHVAAKDETEKHATGSNMQLAARSKDALASRGSNQQLTTRSTENLVKTATAQAAAQSRDNLAKISAEQKPMSIPNLSTKSDANIANPVAGSSEKWLPVVCLSLLLDSCLTLLKLDKSLANKLAGTPAASMSIGPKAERSNPILNAQTHTGSNAQVTRSDANIAKSSGQSTHRDHDAVTRKSGEQLTHRGGGDSVTRKSGEQLAHEDGIPVTHKSGEVSTHHGGESATRKSAEKLAHRGDESVAHKSGEHLAHHNDESSVHHGAEESAAHKSGEHIAHHGSEVPLDKTPESSNNDGGEAPPRKSVGQLAHQFEAPQHKSGDHLAHHGSESVLRKSADQLAHHGTHTPHKSGDNLAKNSHASLNNVHKVAEEHMTGHAATEEIREGAHEQ
ncbi:hypothetical protein HDU93_005243 [Gonapodya sp. JEL0774]|nr:hypothetical protein HDU93_005243 [Gonapodya sp. JEL0774]